MKMPHFVFKSEDSDHRFLLTYYTTKSVTVYFFIFAIMREPLNFKQLQFYTVVFRLANITMPYD